MFEAGRILVLVNGRDCELRASTAARLASVQSESSGPLPGFLQNAFIPIGLIAVAIVLILVLLALNAKSSHFEATAKVQAEQNERNQQAILRLLDEMGSLADGDLTVEATVTEDITGTIADSFNYAIEELRIDTAPLDLPGKVEQTLAASHLPQHFEKSRDGKGQDRKENLEELVNASRQFEYEPESLGPDPFADAEDEADSQVLDELSAFLAHAALEAGEAQGDPYEACVQLMTLHSAKGLEFPLVFLVGMEEGLFPHSMSSDDPGRLEEERRLCYVGITRARQALYISYAEQRRLHGMDNYSQPSRFIGRISVSGTCAGASSHIARVNCTLSCPKR